MLKFNLKTYPFYKEDNIYTQWIKHFEAELREILKETKGFSGESYIIQEILGE